jgi:Flp pilus assembly pilin Flp
MLGLSKRLKRLLRGEIGNTRLEYAMLIALFALAVFILSPSVKNSVLRVFTNTSSALSDGGELHPN